MPSGLSEDTVVEQDARDVFSSRRGVDDLLESFIDHVTIALEVNTIVSALARFTPVARDGARPCRACTVSRSKLPENAV